MKPRPGTNAIDALRSDWRRWTAIVELIARTGSAHHRLDTREYQALYRRLIVASKELAGSADEAAHQVYFDVEATIRPWMMPQVLERADSEILGDLLARCRQIDQKLGGRNWAFLQAPIRVLFFTAASAVGFVFLWATRSGWSQFVVTVQDEARGLWHAFKRSSDVEKIFVIGVILILFAIYNVSRVARA